MFVEVETPGERNADVRVQEANDKGADVIATACPFCIMTLEDPAKEKGQTVMELSEILVEVLT
jgi:Fe-S oxidoreductase